MLSPIRIGVMTSKGSAAAPIVPEVMGMAITSSGASSSVTITLPSGIVSGELLLAFVSGLAYNGGQISTGSSGWTRLNSAANSGSGPAHAVFKKIAGATNTLVVSTSGSRTKDAVCYRIANATTAVTTANMANSSNDFVALPAVNVGSVRTFLCFASLAVAYPMDSVTVPSGYTNLGKSPSEPVSAHCLAAVVRKLLTASSETPGNWRINAAVVPSVAMTTAVY